MLRDTVSAREITWLEHVLVQHWQSRLTSSHASCASQVDGAQKDGTTPIFIAAEWGYLDAVKLLLSRGANINALKSGGVSPYHIACMQGHLEVATFLLRRGSLYWKSYQSLTGLQWAKKFGHEECAQHLASAIFALPVSSRPEHSPVADVFDVLNKGSATDFTLQNPFEGETLPCTDECLECGCDHCDCGARETDGSEQDPAEESSPDLACPALYEEMKQSAHLHGLSFLICNAEWGEQYHFDSVLHSSGLGRIVRAHQPRTGKEVFIKAYAKETIPPSARFVQDIALVRRLKHPNVVSYAEIHQNPAHLYIVMDAVRGRTVADAIARADQGAGMGLPEGLCRQYFQQLICGLHACHIPGLYP